MSIFALLYLFSNSMFILDSSFISVVVSLLFAINELEFNIKHSIKINFLTLPISDLFNIKKTTQNILIF
ncbi:hypothetical protein VAEU17_4290213 [Vibrio aestuarianus]|nr:hypothetical protein VAEU17_4290213 [Vibrio aestuarianus]